MHGDMRSLRHETRFSIEERARKIEALLDVGRKAGAPERFAHLFRDTRKSVTVKFQQNRIEIHQNATHNLTMNTDKEKVGFTSIPPPW